MSEAEEIGKTRHGLEGSPDAQAVGEILHTFHEDLAKFRRECSKNMQELDKMVADFRAKSRENTTNVTSLAEQTATFLLDSCQKDHNRARQVYQLFEEVGRILREFAGESDRHAQELARMFGEFYGRDVDRKEEILQLCAAAYAFLETLRRKRHERREDIQVILGQLRLENRQRVEWMSSMLAKLRAEERDRSHEFEAKDAKISKDVQAAMKEFVNDRNHADEVWQELRSAVEICKQACRAEPTE
jgi:hypothetical protein